MDDSGNIFVAGSFFGTVSFGATSLSTVGSDPDMFVAKWSTSSNSFVWAQRSGGGGPELATALAVSGSSVYVTGYFDTPAGFTTTFGSTTFNSNEQRELFVAKLTDAGTTGSFVWTLHGTGTNAVVGSSLAVDGSSLYVAGDFSGASASFGSALVRPTRRLSWPR